MVSYFKRHIADWMDGTESLSDGAYRAYDVICNLIYLNEGPITLNERGIAGRCNQRLDRFRHYLKELLDAGKLWLDDDGKLHNDRSSRELDAISQNRLNAGKGGSTPRKGSSKHGRESSEDGHEQVSDDKPLKNNDGGEAPLPQGRSLKEKTRQEKTIEPPNPPKGGRGSTLPADWKPSQDLRLYAEGKGLSPPEIDQLAEEMRDWAAANRNRAIARKSDWNATFRGFVRRHLERRLQGSPRQGARPNGEGWLIPFGCKEYWAWREHYTKENSKRLYDFPKEPPSDGFEVKAPCRWPSGLRG